MKLEGKPVKDARKPVTLSITPRDVKNGGRRKADCCAAAQACMRQMKADEARVYLSRVYIRTGDKWTRYATPKSLRTEIVSFDRGHRFEAGEYRLAPLQPTVKLGKKRVAKRRDTGTHPQRGNRVKRHMVAGVRERANGWEREVAA